MKKVILTLAMFVLLVLNGCPDSIDTWSPVSAQGPIMIEQTEIGPPDDATSFMDSTRRNGSFEEPVYIEGDPYTGWDIHPYTDRTDYTSVDGQWSLRQALTGTAKLTQAYQIFDFRNCISDVWIHMCWKISTSEPPQGGELDVCDAALYNEQRVWIAILFHGTNLDASDTWQCDWYRVTGLQDFEEVVLFLDSSDSPPNPSICYWDVLAAHCVIDLPFSVYMPNVMRGWR